MADYSRSSSPIGSLSFSTFLAAHPTILQYKRPESFFRPWWVFWSQNDEHEPSPNTSSFDDLELHNKIRCALSDQPRCHLSFQLIQFWARVKSGDRWILSTSDQPFALTDVDSGFEQHRLRAVEYHYDIDVNTFNEVEKEPGRIISGAPSRAFLNRLPEYVSDLTLHKGCPLVSCALECGFRASFVLPIFSDSSQTCCIGVFECYMEDDENGDAPFQMFNELNDALKNICGLDHAKNEINKALGIIVRSHRIGAVQVWIAYEDENHVPLLSSLDDSQKKQMLGLRLTAHFFKKDYCYDYIEECRNIPLVNGKTLAERTLQNYEAHFHSDFLPAYKLLNACFTLCLKKKETPDLLYVFEFLWDTHMMQPFHMCWDTHHYIIMLEALFSTLQTCLPSFKLASGAELGDELRVIDVDDSTGTGYGFFKILKGNRSSSIPNALDKGKRSVVVVEESSNKKYKTAKKDLPLEKIEQHFGKTMKEAAKALGVSLATLKRKWNTYAPDSSWPGPSSVKRKVDDSKNNQSDTSDKDNGAIEDTSASNKNINGLLTIKAEYACDMIRFHLPISLATLASVEENISKKFNLNPGTYKLRYLDEDEDLILLQSDEDMKYCIKTFQKTFVRLSVTNILPSKFL